MRRFRFTVAVGCALAASSGASALAQVDHAARSLSALELAVACAPPAAMGGEPAHAMRVIGVQDSAPRQLYGSRELLIVDAGTRSGVQLGQEFFLRRQSHYGMAYSRRSSKSQSQGVETAGWIRIVAVNESTAIALVEHACGGIMADDYLEPFAAPTVPAGADRDDATGEPDFKTLGRVVAGSEDRSAGAAGDFMLIDRGSAQGVVPGARFAVYRDVNRPGLPLAAIGEVVVISTGPETALTRITSARGAVLSGDYVARRR